MNTRYFLKKDSAPWTDYVSVWLMSVKPNGEWQNANNTGALELKAVHDVAILIRLFY
jgi:hypothetical protein